MLHVLDSVLHTFQGKLIEHVHLFQLVCSTVARTGTLQLQTCNVYNAPLSRRKRLWGCSHVSLDRVKKSIVEDICLEFEQQLDCW